MLPSKKAHAICIEKKGEVRILCKRQCYNLSHVHTRFSYSKSESKFGKLGQKDLKRAPNRKKEI